MIDELFDKLNSMIKKVGVFIWLMGLAGVGKSTIGERFAERLQTRLGETIWLDGDVLRNALDIRGHTRDIRLDAGIKYLKISQVLISQGKNVILTSVGLQTPFEEFARLNFERYFQVLIHGDPITISKERSFYRDNSPNVMGADLKPDELSYDLIIENNRTKEIDQILFQLEEGFAKWSKN